MVNNQGLYFQREWRLRFMSNGVTYLTYTSIGVDLDVEAPHRLVFNCNPFSAKGEPSSLEVSIYNMSIMEANLVQQNDDIFLEAGYVERGAGLIFAGTIMGFNGSQMLEGNDFNYIFNVYAIAYFGTGGSYASNSQALPQSIDLSEYQVPEPFTLGNQALLVGRVFGFTPSPHQIQPSLVNKPAFNMVVTGDNMHLLLADFSRKTGADLNFDSINRTYFLCDANPNTKTYSEYVRTVDPVIVDRNHGLVGYPTFDPTKQTIAFSRLMDNDISLMISTVSVDLSNTQLTGFTNGITQELTVAYKQFHSFVVRMFSYYGDTRGTRDDWVQRVIAFGQK